MPHLRLEHSQNVTLPAELRALLNQLHGTLAEIGGIRIENFKSRVYAADSYFIGAGNEENGFVHLDIRFLEGRPKAVQQRIGEEAVRILVASCQPLNSAVDLQITAEVRDIARSFYFKYPEGTLTPLSE